MYSLLLRWNQNVISEVQSRSQLQIDMCNAGQWDSYLCVYVYFIIVGKECVFKCLCIMDCHSVNLFKICGIT